MRFLVICLLILLPFISNGQLRVTGRVTDSATGKPLDGASVFFGNTSIGSTTDKNGQFILSRINPGQYDLIVTMVGYETYVQHIAPEVNTPEISIRLQQKAVMIPVVSIMSKEERKRLLNLFIRDFIGTAAEAAQCRITNMDAIFLEFDKKANQLNASTEDFLIIENKRLGYRLKFLIQQFDSNYAKRLIYYEGQALFEEMKGSQSMLKRWQKNRRATFFGSPMHFFRSLIKNNDQGFVVRRLVRLPNTSRPPDSLIRIKMKQFAWHADSLRYWSDKMNTPRVLQTLYNEPLTVKQIVALTDVRNVYALKFPDLLYITYPQRKQTDYATSSIDEQPLNGEAGASILKLNEAYALFDANGIILNPKSVVYEGVWADEKISHLLPNNYEP